MGCLIVAPMKSLAVLATFAALVFANPVRAEEPADAAARFFREYMARVSPSCAI